MSNGVFVMMYCRESGKINRNEANQNCILVPFRTSKTQSEWHFNSFNFAYMTVAINLCVWSGAKENASLVESICRQLAARCPRDLFVFFSNSPESAAPIRPNIHQVSIGTGQLAGIRHWYAFRLKQELKKWNPDCIIHADGMMLNGCRFRQVAVLPFADASMWSQLNKPYRKAMMNQLGWPNQERDRYISCWPGTAGFLESDLKYTVNNIYRLSWPGRTPDVLPDGLDKEKTRQRFTEGREYFICSYSNPDKKDIIFLLKAFSLFKIRQKTNMMLVLLLDKPDTELSDKINSYQFKNELLLIAGADMPDRQALVHGAYAWISTADKIFCLQELVMAMQLQVPVLFSHIPFAIEPFPEAIDTFPPDSPGEIAQKMMRIFKDESFRNSLIQAGIAITQNLSLDRTADELAQLLKPVASPAARQ